MVEKNPKEGCEKNVRNVESNKEGRGFFEIIPKEEMIYYFKFKDIQSKKIKGTKLPEPEK